VPLLTMLARNMGIAAKVLLLIQFLQNHLLAPSQPCTGQSRNDGLVIGCNPYP
jgi:IMP dehydrogenase